MSNEPEATENDTERSDNAAAGLASALPQAGEANAVAEAVADPAMPQSQRSTPKAPPVAEGEPQDPRIRLASQPDLEEARRPGPAMINQEATTSRRARGRMTLRIPDDNVPVSRSPSSPDLEAQAAATQRRASSPDLDAAAPAVTIQAMRIIAVGDSPAPAMPAGELSPSPGPALTPQSHVLTPLAGPALMNADESSEALTPDDIMGDMLAEQALNAAAASFESPELGGHSAATATAPVSGVVTLEPSISMGREEAMELTDEEITPDSTRQPSPPAPVAEPRAVQSSKPSLTGEQLARDPLQSIDVPVEMEEEAGVATELSAAQGQLPPPRAAMPALDLTDSDAEATPLPVRALEPARPLPESQQGPVVISAAPPLQPPPVALAAGAGVQRVGSSPSLEAPPPQVLPATPPPAAAAPVETVEVIEEYLEVEEAAAPAPTPPPAPPAPAHVPPPAPPIKAKPAAKPAETAPVSASQPPRSRVRPWWEDLFTDDFVRSMDKLTPDQIKRECKFIEESLAVQKGGVMLDLGCGGGHHAVELASRGYNVVGYDLSLTMLALAADEAQNRGQKLNFLQGDMREMAFEEMFDGVFSWATSFGYFDHEKNCDVLRRVQRALRTGGMFLLDIVNRDFLISRTPTMGWFEGDGCVCMDEAKFDCITSRLQVKRTLMLDDGRSREVEFSIRLYSLHEIGKMVNDAGFKVVDVSGHPATTGVFMGAESPRLITLAEKR